jgi:hypothetical protein
MDRAQTGTLAAQRNAILARLSPFEARDPEKWRISALGPAKVGTTERLVMLNPELPPR